MSDKWWVTKIEWGVRSDEWWKKEKQTAPKDSNYTTDT